MKFFIPLLAHYFENRTSRRNIRMLLLFVVVFLALVLIYAVVFHILMEREGMDHTWLTGVYWTLTVMSTLGFGDIVFHTDLGRAFAMLVLLSGMIFLLVLLPFTFIEFFYAPWMEAQSAGRAPRRVPDSLKGHAIITHYDPVTAALVTKLNQYGHPYVIVVRELEEALRLHDQGFNIMVGEPDSPDTYERAGVDRAAFVAATDGDILNTNVAFTVRELSKNLPIATTASSGTSIEVLRLAGSNLVFQLGELMGQSLARRTIGGDALAHVIGQFDQLQIAEATVAGTPLVDKTLLESRLREILGINVIGVWERGRFESASAQTKMTAKQVLVLAASAEQIRSYNEQFCIYHQGSGDVVIIGGGRVGRATGRALKERNIGYKIVERLPERVRDPERYVVGNAAEFEVLKKAGINEASTVIVTTHDDDTNIYLTIYCRKLRPDIQIISRATGERNVSTLHRAGADFVMSYASMGASIIFNILRRGDILMVAEGLNVFRVKVPPSLAGRSLAETEIRSDTGASVIAINSRGKLQVNPDPVQPLEADAEIILIGTVEAEDRFLKTYGQKA